MATQLPAAKPADRAGCFPLGRTVGWLWSSRGLLRRSMLAGRQQEIHAELDRKHVLRPRGIWL